MIQKKQLVCASNFFCLVFEERALKITLCYEH